MIDNDSYKSGASQMWQLFDIIISRYLKALEGDMKEVNNVDDARKLFDTLAIALSANTTDILFALNMASPDRLENVITDIIDRLSDQND